MGTPVVYPLSRPTGSRLRDGSGPVGQQSKSFSVSLGRVFKIITSDNNSLAAYMEKEGSWDKGPLSKKRPVNFVVGRQKLSQPTFTVLRQL